MAKIQIDLSGIRGLTERHQGDLNDTTPKPHLRYIGSEGQMADGIYNPYKILGFMSPANNVFTALTGTISADIVSIVHDAIDDTVYIAEASEKILQLDGLNDTSVAAYKSLTSGYTIDDMVLYEANGARALVYAIDTNNSVSGLLVGVQVLEVGTGLESYTFDVIDSTSNVVLGELVQDSEGTGSSFTYRKFAQKFNSSLLASFVVSGIKLPIVIYEGDGAGYTIKASIQASESKANSPFTNRGAWATSTSYAINDVVTVSSVDYQCHTANTSSASDQPGVGGNWKSYWDIFGAPTGVELISGTINGADITQSTDTPETRNHYIEFSADYTLTANTDYWLVIEESGSNMDSSDTVGIAISINDSAFNPTYHSKGYITSGATDHWREWAFNAGDVENVDFQFYYKEEEDWTNNNIVNADNVDRVEEQFLHVAENGLLYWVAGNYIHTIDGSFIGGSTGTFTKNAVVFPSYLRVADITETSSRMFIGLNSSARTIPSTAAEKDYKYFPANVCGVFIWDRRSNVVTSNDFLPCPGAKEIKALFTGHDGSVYVISESNSGFGELRAMSNRQFQTIQTFERFGFPRTRRSVEQVGSSVSKWIGANGIIYAYGQVSPGAPAGLYKTGVHPTGIDDNVALGPLFVGNEYSTGPQIAALIGVDNGLKKWYPNGESTIGGVNQTGNAGNVYSKVELLPNHSTVNYINIFGIPTVSDTIDDIANIKIYFNLSSTAWATKTVTKKDMNKGYIEIPVGKSGVFSVQLEVEWPTDELIGTDTFCPMYAMIDFTPNESAGGKS